MLRTEEYQNFVRSQFLSQCVISGRAYKLTFKVQLYPPIKNLLKLIILQKGATQKLCAILEKK